MGDSPRPEGLGNAIAAVGMATVAVALSLFLAAAAPSKPQSGKDLAVTQERASAEPKALVDVASKTPISNTASPAASTDPSTASSNTSSAPGNASAASNSSASTSSTGSSAARVMQATALDTDTFKVSEPRLDATAKPALQDYAMISKPVSQDTTPAQPAAKTKEYLPAGGGLPTPVSIKNSGGSSAPVQRVEFTISKPFKSPTRENSTAKVEGIPVTFAETNYDAKADKFSVSLTAPQVAAVPNQPIPLVVAIVWPKYAGWSYRGKLHVYQAGQQPVTLENVEVDIVKTAAK